MKNILKLEEMAMLGVSIFALTLFHADWWWYLLLGFGPDISMLGYAAGNTTGAFCYNLFHHKAVAIVVFVIGLSLKNEILQLTGIVLFGHSSMDRMFGYGLKLNEGFKYTHLGITGKK
ncbi:MAG: DUF4260 domain-containing protein [Bacteroidota bacterium]